METGNSIDFSGRQHAPRSSFYNKWLNVEHAFAAPPDISVPDCTVISLFEGRVGQYPGNTAVVSGGSQVSYEDLSEQINRVARFLIDQCDLQQGQFVGVMLDRGTTMAAGLFGVLKAGGVCVPI